jgi:hypothetical protein
MRQNSICSYYCLLSAILLLPSFVCVSRLPASSRQRLFFYATLLFPVFLSAILQLSYCCPLLCAGKLTAEADPLRCPSLCYPIPLYCCPLLCAGKLTPLRCPSLCYPIPLYCYESSSLPASSRQRDQVLCGSNRENGKLKRERES